MPRAALFEIVSCHLPLTMRTQSSRRAARHSRVFTYLFRGHLRRVGLELGTKLARLFPAHHVERFDELADAVDLCAERAEFDDLFVAEVLGKQMLLDLLALFRKRDARLPGAN